MTEQGRKAPPESPIGPVIAYARSNWAAQLRFTEHGELSIDNNLAERMLRAQAVGRRNWTFLGSDRDGLSRSSPSSPRPTTPAGSRSATCR